MFASAPAFPFLPGRICLLDAESGEQLLQSMGGIAP